MSSLGAFIGKQLVAWIYLNLFSFLFLNLHEGSKDQQITQNLGDQNDWIISPWMVRTGFAWKWVTQLCGKGILTFDVYVVFRVPAWSPRASVQKNRSRLSNVRCFLGYPIWKRIISFWASWHRFDGLFLQLIFFQTAFLIILVTLPSTAHIAPKILLFLAHIPIHCIHLEETSSFTVSQRTGPGLPTSETSGVLVDTYASRPSQGLWWGTCVYNRHLSFLTPTNIWEPVN